MGTQLCNFPCQRIESAEYTVVDLVKKFGEKQKKFFSTSETRSEGCELE
jgi:hypothetical protein